MTSPRYGEASLPDVLPGVLAALGVPDSPDPLGLAARLDGVRRVAVLLVDGLGWHLLPVAAPVAPTVADVVAGRLGTVLELTAGFPSTTPTSLVGLGTGALPGAHGVLGFFLKIPGTERILDPRTWRDDPDPPTWQPVPSQFARAVAAGVTVTVVSRPEFEGSGLTRAAYGDVPYRGAPDIDTLAAEIRAALAAGPPTLVYGYHPTLDTMGHVFGVDSPRWREAAAEVDALLTRLVDGLPGDAALLVTADHGQLNVPPEARFDVGTDPRLDAGLTFVAGEPRVRYLYTRPGAVPDVVDAWRAVLGTAAAVLTRDEAVATGWYGPVPPRHLARLGDVVVICRDRYAVLDGGRDLPGLARLVGFHGSATPDEMLVPLIVVRGNG